MICYPLLSGCATHPWRYAPKTVPLTRDWTRRTLRKQALQSVSIDVLGCRPCRCEALAVRTGGRRRCDRVSRRMWHVRRSRSAGIAGRDGIRRQVDGGALSLSIAMVLAAGVHRCLSSALRVKDLNDTAERKSERMKTTRRNEPPDQCRWALPKSKLGVHGRLVAEDASEQGHGTIQHAAIPGRS